jgi:hypothetical protein
MSVQSEGVRVTAPKPAAFVFGFYKPIAPDMKLHPERIRARFTELGYVVTTEETDRQLVVTVSKPATPAGV